MLTHYHSPKSRSSRIVWLLEELGVPQERKIVSIRRGDGSGHEQGPEYRKIHPHAKMPAIVHEGVTVFETPAVALYLTDAFPKADFGPLVGDKLRGPYLSWLSYSTGTIEPSVTTKMLNVPHRHGAFGWAPADEMEDVLERALKAGPYLLGEKFTAADIVVGGSIAFLIPVKLISPRPVFSAYVERLTARPAFKSAMEKDAIGAPAGPA